MLLLDLCLGHFQGEILGILISHYLKGENTKTKIDLVTSRENYAPLGLCSLNRLLPGFWREGGIYNFKTNFFSILQSGLKKRTNFEPCVGLYTTCPSFTWYDTALFFNFAVCKSQCHTKRRMDTSYFRDLLS